MSDLLEYEIFLNAINNIGCLVLYIPKVQIYERFVGNVACRNCEASGVNIFVRSEIVHVQPQIVLLPST